MSLDKFIGWFVGCIFFIVISIIVLGIGSCTYLCTQKHTTHGVVHSIHYERSFRYEKESVIIEFENGRMERFNLFTTNTWLGDINKDMEYTVNGMGYITDVKYHEENK